MGMYDVCTYEIKFYSSDGCRKSDWPVYSYTKRCTYEQAEKEAEREMRAHPNWDSYRIIEK